MRPLSLRLCLVVALVLIVIVAFFSTEGPALLLSQGTVQEQHNSAVLTALLADNAHWTDPAWQKELTAQLSVRNMAVVIRNAAGQAVYHAGVYNQNEPMFQEIVVTDGTGQIGTAFLYECTPLARVVQQWLLVGLIVLFLTLAGVVCFIVLTVLKPLSALAQAAHRVAQNDLDFHLPVTYVREVAKVCESFNIMREALRESLTRQAEVEQERRIFISAIAHDLRTPLFSLRGYLDGLGSGLAQTPAKAHKYLAVCQAKAATLERLISDLFAYTQLEYLEQVPRREALEINTLITHILESLEPQVKNRGVVLIPEAPAISCIVQVDAHLLTRVFENLLDNALRYTPAGGSISVRWYPEGNRLVFTVSDTGPGIMPADLPHLFTPLYRGDPSRNANTGSAGLGLTIAQRILRAHGGDLTAANAASGGAVFTGSFTYKEWNVKPAHARTMSVKYA
ncbi:MAG TPA: HAMP domain-containing sensor histidine kinase [Ktedonobacteraceae bacterium]|nr:HAMP domain-containing sensor histidine kinase [Ktedonobacteraceae bacterium]